MNMPLQKTENTRHIQCHALQLPDQTSSGVRLGVLGLWLNAGDKKQMIGQEHNSDHTAMALVERYQL